MKDRVAAILIVVGIVLVFCAQGVGGDGVSIKNVPPKTSKVCFNKENGLYNLTVIASDYNGWEDITHVNATIHDMQGKTISSFGYYQYENSSMERDPNKRVHQFENYEGDVLDINLSKIRRVKNGDALSVKTELMIEFHFEIDSGWTIQIEIKDTFHEVSTASFEFPTLLRRVFKIAHYAVIVAALSTAFVSYRFFKNKERMEVT